MITYSQILFPSCPWPISAIKYFTQKILHHFLEKSIQYIFQENIRLVNILISFRFIVLYYIFNGVADTEPHLIIHILICPLFGEYLCSLQCFPYTSEKCGCRTKLYLLLIHEKLMQFYRLIYWSPEVAIFKLPHQSVCVCVL